MTSDEIIDSQRWVCREQFDAVRHVFAEAMYCNRQLHTVLQMRDVEVAEQAKQIARLQALLSRDGEVIGG